MAKRGTGPPAGRGKPGTAPPDRSSPPVPPPPPVPPVPPSPGDTLEAAFNGLRDELVSTLAYVLGNREDAIDAAQETFLKCWRARESIPGVQNLRAWIFRVGLNTARDVQRSGWMKRSKPL